MKYRKKFEIEHLEHWNDQSNNNASIRLFVIRQFAFRYTFMEYLTDVTTIYNSNQ